MAMTRAAADVKLFLSCVSDEFGIYREALRHALTRPNVFAVCSFMESKLTQVCNQV